MMQCPNDGQTLAMTTREGIEIDYCPTCRLDDLFDFG